MRGYIKTAFKNDAAHTLTKQCTQHPVSREEKGKKKEKEEKNGKGREGKTCKGEKMEEKIKMEGSGRWMETEGRGEIAYDGER